MGNNITSFVVASLATFSIACSGCGNNASLAPVSGTATYQGQPVAKLGVFFSPQPVGENFSPGPYSRGTTDEDGKFSLVTRHKDPGALIGLHTVTLKYADIGETEMADLRQNLAEAKEFGDKEGFAELKKKIAKVQAKLKGRPVITGFQKTVDVPSGGIEDLKLDLSEMLKE